MCESFLRVRELRLAERAADTMTRLVNNAGISIEAGRAPLKVHETPVDTWDVTMAVNSRSVFLGCKYACGQMEKQEANEAGDRGWIINMSSIFGLVGGSNNCEWLLLCLECKAKPTDR